MFKVAKSAQDTIVTSFKAVENTAHLVNDTVVITRKVINKLGDKLLAELDNEMDKE